MQDVDEEQYEQEIHGHLNYKGDVRDSFDDSRPYGPNRLNELFWAVSAEYDEGKNMTRVAFSKNPPARFLQTMAARSR
jgi:hypothetical protein